MNKWMCGLAIAMLLAGCHGHDDQATGDKTPSAADVQSGNTKDSVDPSLNALQRTKRTMNGIEEQRKQQEDAAGVSDSPAP